MTWVMPRLEGEIGMFLALTGKRVENTDCNKIGLATHFIPVEDICAFEQESANVMTNELSDMFTWYDESPGFFGFGFGFFFF
jgi:enoyl-CoA hydratase/carnithine racemase